MWEGREGTGIGDNTAEWSHLKASIPMLMSIIISKPFNGGKLAG